MDGLLIATVFIVGLGALITILLFIGDITSATASAFGDKETHEKLEKFLKSYRLSCEESKRMAEENYERSSDETAGLIIGALNPLEDDDY